MYKTVNSDTQYTKESEELPVVRYLYLVRGRAYKPSSGIGMWGPHGKDVSTLLYDSGVVVIAWIIMQPRIENGSWGGQNPEETQPGI